MPPKRNKTKNDKQRAKRSSNKTEKKTLVSEFDEMEVGSSSTAASQPTPSASEPQPTVSGNQATLISKYPLYERWESMEEEERGRVRDAHRIQTGPFAFQPEYLPVQIHVAAQQQGRFTREIESDMVKCNTIEAVKDVVKSSLTHELVRTNIDPTRTKFAGLMIYGPTKEFTKESIRNHTKGLFLDADAYKKWWLQTNKTRTWDGEMVKIAVVLWHQEEAAAKQVELPDFWTNPTAGMLANYLEKMKSLWEGDEFEQANLAYVRMLERLQQQRCEAEETRAQLTEKMDTLVKARRLAVQWKKSTSGKGKEVAVDDDEGAGADEGDEDIEDEEVEDADDEDYEE
ncbi:hypothetical protein LTR99_004165 [Exophiala xenobiotica]|uniref:Uncharacterized protein n=1 Tax=Vermiconidia calcicola TaxID=1690605 RepID=A0AAV9QJR8_9PEZI|nr:hypothetical protein LTR92_010118 [Exophiala xenobiotica]KAK5545073.1 hypothetical protein LTR25_000080 [Vermiconidia calcicola]KAK5549283.1 hypothetical protein LTR23_001113 [Chaetothyriales sp. CCFEE 6169]KAK5268429.1 hypothetical protein LTR96_006136 [Exophiala xenobiotica]KAK5305099.1 hypothetical protein LTR99_004165 [Exophiala xenobiotica]